MSRGQGVFAMSPERAAQASTLPPSSTPAAPASSGTGVRRCPPLAAPSAAPAFSPSPFLPLYPPKASAPGVPLGPFFLQPLLHLLADLGPSLQPCLRKSAQNDLHTQYYGPCRSTAPLGAYTTRRGVVGVVGVLVGGVVGVLAYSSSSSSSSTPRTSRRTVRVLSSSRRSRRSRLQAVPS